MESILKYKLLTVPLFVWGLQLLYVAIALGVLFVLTDTLRAHVLRLSAQVLYVAAMVAVNIAWRVAIKRLKPEWF